MKKFIKSFALVCLMVSFTSCNNDDKTTPVEPTISGIVSTNADFSTLKTALERTGLTATLNGTGQFTVFAPTNAAFTSFFASLGSNVTVNNVDAAVLKNILLNHVVASEIKSAAIPAAAYVATLSPINSTTTSPTISMFVQKSGSNVFINGGTSTTGVRVTTADVDASNGVVHIVNEVIKIPTIVDHVVANPEFDQLQAVVTGASQTDVLAALSGLTPAAPATLFAPNNAAFTSALGTGGFANGATTSQVTRVLQYHVVSGNVRSSQLTNNLSVPTLATNPTNNVTFVLANGTVDIRDTANNLSRVNAADIQCSNGVIHGVNRVLQPTL